MRVGIRITCPAPHRTARAAPGVSRTCRRQPVRPAHHRHVQAQHGTARNTLVSAAQPAQQARTTLVITCRTAPPRARARAQPPLPLYRLHNKRATARRAPRVGRRGAKHAARRGAAPATQSSTARHRSCRESIFTKPRLATRNVLLFTCFFTGNVLLPQHETVRVGIREPQQPPGTGPAARASPSTRLRAHPASGLGLARQHAAAPGCCGWAACAAADPGRRTKPVTGRNRHAALLLRAVLSPAHLLRANLALTPRATHA
jgi:hypothetical protein